MGKTNPNKLFAYHLYVFIQQKLLGRAQWRCAGVVVEWIFYTCWGWELCWGSLCSRWAACVGTGWTATATTVHYK